jgi:hypothetical protein
MRGSRRRAPGNRRQRPHRRIIGELHRRNTVERPVFDHYDAHEELRNGGLLQATDDAEALGQHRVAGRHVADTAEANAIERHAVRLSLSYDLPSGRGPR